MDAGKEDQGEEKCRWSEDVHHGRRSRVGRLHEGAGRQLMLCSSSTLLPGVTKISLYPVDAIVAADVLCYFGDLVDFFKEARRILATGRSD